MQKTVLCALLVVGSLAASPARAGESSFRLVSTLLAQTPPETSAVAGPERLSLEERLASYESWRSAGKVLTYTGIVAGGLGVLMTTVGLAAYWAGALSFNLGQLTGGALVFSAGLVSAGIGAAALAVGIPLWAVYGGRIDRVRQRLAGGRPFVFYDPLTRATTGGWAFSF